MKTTDCAYVYVDWKLRYIEVSLSYEDWEEDDSWIARCPELLLSDYGETQREAINNLSEMIMASLHSAIDKGNLDAMLRKLGFKTSKMPIPKRNLYKLEIKTNERIKPLPIISDFFSIPASILSNP